MKLSIHYALATGSDISETDRTKVLDATWENMHSEGAVLRQRIEDYVQNTGAGPYRMLENFDYAIAGVAELPHECVIYDYWRCVEVLVVRNRMSMAEASDRVEDLIEKMDELDNGPMFIFPMDYVENEEEQDLDDYDILNAHEVVFPKDKAN
jgi:hypothetical protein